MYYENLCSLGDQDPSFDSAITIFEIFALSPLGDKKTCEKLLSCVAVVNAPDLADEYGGSHSRSQREGPSCVSACVNQRPPPPRATARVLTAVRKHSTVDE